MHSYANYPDGKTIPERQSRHFYDFYSLLNSEGKQIALKNIELLEKDNHAMAEIFSEKSPSWKEIIDLIEKFELDFNE